MGVDCINVYAHLEGECQEDGARDFFPVVSGDRRWGSGHKLAHRSSQAGVPWRYGVSEHERSRGGCGVRAPRWPPGAPRPHYVSRHASAPVGQP